MQPLLLSLLGLNASVFAWAIARLFERPSSMPTAMRLLSVLGLAALFIQAASIITAPAPSLPIGLTAAVVYLLSLGLFGWASATIRHRPLLIAFAQAPPEGPPPLVSHGPFSLVRHPFYLAYALTWIAGVLAARTFASAAAASTMLAVYWRMAVDEERSLLARDDSGRYLEYVHSTPRFVPRLIRRPTIGTDADAS